MCSQDADEMLTYYLFADKFGFHPRETDMLTEKEFECFAGIEETLSAIRKANEENEKQRQKAKKRT